MINSDLITSDTEPYRPSIIPVINPVYMAGIKI